MTLTRDSGVEALLASWMRGLRADGKSPKTLESYALSVRQFTAWCLDDGRPAAPADLDRADVQEFIAHIIDTRSSGTAGVRYRSLKQWFDWLVAEDEADNVMAGMKHPKLDEKVPQVITDDNLRALLDVTKGRGFKDRRDHALLRVLIDTGMRRGELSALSLGDVDLDGGLLLVSRSKTKRGRLVPVGTKSIASLDRYLRSRATHRYSSSDRVWLGHLGPLSGEGIRQMVKTRCVEAGIGHVHVHQFRHTAAHRWLIAGGQEQDLARIAGWTPGSAMLSRYGASAAAERAKEAHRRLAPGDSL